MKNCNSNNNQYVDGFYISGNKPMYCFFINSEKYQNFCIYNKSIDSICFLNLQKNFDISDIRNKLINHPDVKRVSEKECVEEFNMLYDCKCCTNFSVDFSESELQNNQNIFTKFYEKLLNGIELFSCDECGFFVYDDEIFHCMKCLELENNIPINSYDLCDTCYLLENQEHNSLFVHKPEDIDYFVKTRLVY